MSEIKHTVRPWDVTANGINVKSIYLDTIVCFGSDEVSDEEAQANAALISAAPDMLEELISVRAVLHTLLNDVVQHQGATAEKVIRRRVETISATIEKAKGGAI